MRVLSALAFAACMAGNALAFLPASPLAAPAVAPKGCVLRLVLCLVGWF